MPQVCQATEDFTHDPRGGTMPRLRVVAAHGADRSGHPMHRWQICTNFFLRRLLGQQTIELKCQIAGSGTATSYGSIANNGEAVG
mmetsp:Transcript_62244/g.176806  ORF Transcript_62244/g.176806 Transcript_62244/m.176806 type:complete len:85 (-) Transcript_62244:684-938(-)